MDEWRLRRLGSVRMCQIATSIECSTARHNECAGGASARGDPSVPVLEEGAVGACGCHGRDPECAFEVGVTRPGSSRTGPACRFVLTVANTGPGRQLGWSAERGHVCTGLGEDVLCSGGADPRDGGEQIAGPGQVMGTNTGVDDVGDLVDVLVEQVDAIEVEPHQVAVVGGEVSGEREAQLSSERGFLGRTTLTFSASRRTLRA